jgi:hypothetical protein
MEKWWKAMVEEGIEITKKSAILSFALMTIEDMATLHYRYLVDPLVVDSFKK